MQEERAQGNWLSKLSISWILPVVVVAPALVVSLVLTLLCYQTGRRTANDLAGQEIRQIHERIESHLSQLMDLPPAINRLNRSRLDNNILALDDPARNPRSIFETLQAFPDVSSIVMGSAQGQVMWVIRYPGESTYEYAIKRTPDALMQEYTMSADGQIGPTPKDSYKFNTVMRPWYRAAIAADAPTWGNVYIWVRGGKGVTLGVSYVEPYRDAAGNLLGVINCELTLADISAFMRPLEIGKTGIAFIIERDGNIVANSIGMDCMKNGTDRLAAADASDPRIVDAFNQLKQSFGSLQSINGMRVADVMIAGQPTQMVVSSYQNRRNLDWLVVTLVPDADFLADVQATRVHGMMIGAAAVLAALLLGIFMAIWLLRPILAVVSHARRVGGGDLEARIHRNDNREIAQLASALNEMADGLKERMNLRHSLTLAMEVQQSLLPSTTPRLDGLDIAARSKYCDETGGDYYDYLDVEDLGPHSVMIAMGDVAGHGIAAAMLMATARGVLRSQVATRGSLGHLLTHVNGHLVADTKGQRFMTMFLAVVDTATMSMRWASAGHDAPLIYDPEKRGLLGGLDDQGGGLPLGVMEAEVYEEQTLANLRQGQVMLFGTDGLWESKNSADEEFGKARVAQAIADLADRSAAEIENGIYQRLQQFCGGRASDDDITYVVVKLAGKTREPH